MKKPETSNPSTNWSANKTIHALITKRNKPKVIMVAGRVKKIKGGEQIYSEGILPQQQ